MHWEAPLALKLRLMEQVLQILCFSLFFMDIACYYELLILYVIE